MGSESAGDLFQELIMAQHKNAGGGVVASGAYSIEGQALVEKVLSHPDGQALMEKMMSGEHIFLGVVVERTDIRDGVANISYLTTDGERVGFTWRRKGLDWLKDAPPEGFTFGQIITVKQIDGEIQSAKALSLPIETTKSIVKRALDANSNQTLYD